MKEIKKKKWTKKELDEFITLIIEKREVLAKELQEAKQKADDVLNSNSNNAIYSSHMADAGSDQMEMEKNLDMTLNLEQHLS